MPRAPQIASHLRAIPASVYSHLAERLARGDIDTEEYERRLAALRATSERERTQT